MVSKQLSKLRGVFLLVLLILPTLTFATISISVDRESIVVDESFQIIFESNESVGQPDFSPLKKDFEILSTSQSSNTSVINEKIESKKRWVLDVIAKRDGKLTVPSVKFGKKKTQPALVEEHMSATFEAT